MKFVVLTLALIGVASAGYVAPLVGGYNGFNPGFVNPTIASFNAPIASVTPAAPIVRNYVAAGPAVANYGAIPVVRNYVAAQPVAAYSAVPAVASYGAVPAVSTFGGPAVVGHGFGNDAFGFDLWKKKKAAAH